MAMRVQESDPRRDASSADRSCELPSRATFQEVLLVRIHIQKV